MRTLGVAALVLVLVLALGAAPVAAAGKKPVPSAPHSHQPTPHGPLLRLKLPSFAPRPQPFDTYRPLSAGSGSFANNDPLKSTTVDLGPFSARLGGSTRGANLARYRLDGTDLLGGSLSGTVDTRGARVFLKWPPDEGNE